MLRRSSFLSWIIMKQNCPGNIRDTLRRVWESLKYECTSSLESPFLGNLHKHTELECTGVSPTCQLEGWLPNVTPSYIHHSCLLFAAAAAKSLQLCPTLCDPIDSSPPSFPVPGILQAITLVWVAMSFSNAWKWKAKVKSLSRVWLLATPWTAAYQAPPSMGFSRQEYWSGVPLPSPAFCLPGV